MLENRVALITGATGGLGRHVTRTLSTTAVSLALTARRPEPLEKLRNSLNLPPERVWVTATDLTDPNSVQKLVDEVLERFGRLDILINLIGGWRGGVRLADLTDEMWQQMLHLNLQSAFLINRAALKPMLTQGWGRIINIGSRAAERPGTGQGAYNVAKAGVVALTKSIAADYRRQGIAANVILPGTIDTPANRQAMPHADTSRWVDPHDIAQLALFLCSEAGGAINGAAIPIYGTA